MTNDSDLVAKPSVKLPTGAGLEHRSILNFVLQTPVQGRLFFISFVVAVLSALPFIWINVFTLVKVGEVCSSPDATCTADAINAALMTSLRTSIWVWVLMMICLFIFTAIQTHRVAGPIKILSAHLDRFLAGDFSRPVTLRSYDELKDVAKKLEQLRLKLLK